MPANFWVEHHGAHGYMGARFEQLDGQAVIVEDDELRRVTVACHDNRQLADATVRLEMGSEAVQVGVNELLYAIALSCGRCLSFTDQGAALGAPGGELGEIPRL